MEGGLDLWFTVKRTLLLYQRIGFSSQHPRGGLQLTITTVSGADAIFWPLQPLAHTCIHSGVHIKLLKISISKNIVK